MFIGTCASIGSIVLAVALLNIAVDVVNGLIDPRLRGG
jgi:ABC-type dipeptide/oligopeptide/nickel transport system permease component